MSKWNFKVKSSPGQVISKLETTLSSVADSIFKVNKESGDSTLFSYRKRIKYPDQILHRNRLIINGKILNSSMDNESTIEVNFSQPFITVVTLFSILVFGATMVALIINKTEGVLLYALAAVVIIIGISLWMAFRIKFKRDVENYKKMISEILI